MRLFQSICLLLALPLLAVSQEGERPLTRPSGAQATDLPTDWFRGAIAGIEHAEYEYSLTAAGAASAPNRSQDLRSWVRSTGIEIAPRSTSALGEGATWSLALRTASFGRSGEITELQAGGVSAQGAEARIARGALTEWYRNDERGIEQGWDIASAPEGDGPLWIGLVADGDLSLRLNAGGLSGRWVDGVGVARLRYHGLRAWDANDRELSARIVPSNTGFGIEVMDEGAVYPITVDPFLSGPAWTGESDQANAEFGFSVATAGDVNADGYSDVIVGAPLYDGGDAEEGAAFLFFGSAAGLSLTPDWTTEGDLLDARHGHSVCTAGDVNDDGFDDVLVGAPRFSNVEVAEGRAAVYYGSAVGPALIPDWTAEIDQAGARFGEALCTAGDVDGDGIDDVIIGAPRYDNPEIGEGLAVVYLGSVSGLALAPVWSVESDQSGANLGSSVSTAGDVDGDGFCDVIVGAFEFDNADAGAGMAAVHLGSATGPAPTAAWSVEGTAADQNYGNSVAGAGDVNGDGYADIVVGVPFFSNGHTSEGAAAVYHGSPTGPSPIANFAVEGNANFAVFGLSVSTAGDVNGDGYADIVVGAPLHTDNQSNEGRARVFVGSAAGLIGVADFTVDGNQVGALMGAAVCAAGDVNGDGYGDVIIGARSFDNGEANEGRAFLFEGSVAGLATSSAWSAGGDQPGTEFGYSVDSAGDVNGDGFSDVIVGAPSHDNGEVNEGAAFVFHGSTSGLSISADWSGESNTVAALYGSAVATAGDVNGDGYSDVIVGAPMFANGEAGEGGAFLYLGSSGGLGLIAAWATESHQLGASLGTSVSTAGDVNGDGFDDIVVGIPNFDNPENNEGLTAVYLGSASGPSAVPHWTGEINQAGAFYGASVATAGDVNGDGYSDIIVGAPLYDDGEVNEGRIFVYHGSANGIATQDFSFDQDVAGALYGASVASAGDVNGDGYDDIVVGARFHSNTTSQEGACYVYNGSASGLSGPASFSVEGGQSGAELGRSVASAGDVNGDGYSDIIVGTHFFDLPQNDEGVAVVYAGSATGVGGVPFWIGQGDQIGAEYGYSVACAGDVNGDGFSDIIVGARAHTDGEIDEGGAFVYHGNNGGSAALAPQQRLTADTGPIHVHGLSDSTHSFRIRANAHDPNGTAGTPAGRTSARLEWETESPGVVFDGIGLGSGSDSDTGAVGGTLTLNEEVTGLASNSAHKWRARIATSNPFFPHGPWFTAASTGFSAYKLRTETDCNGNMISDSTDILGASPDCNGNGIPDECDLTSLASEDSNSNLIPDECELISSFYCFCNTGPCGNDDASAGCANSTGGGAVISASGTASLANDDLTLSLSPMAPFESGIFYVGPNQLGVEPVLGDGRRCVGGATNRFPVVNAGPAGILTFNSVLGFGNSAFVPHNLFLAGTTWNYQGWYRDGSGPCGSTFNLSNAITITVTP